MPGLRDILEAATRERPGLNPPTREETLARFWLHDNAPELAALCLDMGGELRMRVCPCTESDYQEPDCPICPLLARLDQLGKAVVTQTVDDCRRQGVSVGRALANSACSAYEARAEAAEAEVQRLREGLREIERMAGAAGYGETPAKPIARKARFLLLADSPDGDCEHDYVFLHGMPVTYRCDKCGATSDDGVYPRVGSFHPHKRGGGAK